MDADAGVEEFVQQEAGKLELSYGWISSCRLMVERAAASPIEQAVSRGNCPGSPER